MKRSRELTVCGMLTALAIILSIVERAFPSRASSSVLRMS